MGTVLAKVIIADSDGDAVIMEIDDSMLGDDEVALASREPGRALLQASETLQDSFERITRAVGELLVRLRSMPNAPEQTEIQFGLKMGGEAGLIFARGTAEVNFNVKMSWQKPGV